MAAVPALAQSNYLFLPAPRLEARAPESASAKLERSLRSLFPDLLVQGTHNCLLGMTSSLTKVSRTAHAYFTRLSQILAFEGMMRSFMRFAAAASPFPIDLAPLQTWSSMFLPAPQPATASPWAFPAPPQKTTPALPFFPVLAPEKVPASQPASMALLPAIFQPQFAAPSHNAGWPDYSALAIVPMALLAAAPALDQLWSFGF